MRKRPLDKWLGTWPWLIWPVAFAGGLVMLASSVSVHVLLDRLDSREVSRESLIGRVLIYGNGALVMALLYAWNLRPFPAQRGVVAVASYALLSTLCVALLKGRLPVIGVMTLFLFMATFFSTLFVVSVWFSNRSRNQRPGESPLVDGRVHPGHKQINH